MKVTNLSPSVNVAVLDFLKAIRQHTFNQLFKIINYNYGNFSKIFHGCSKKVQQKADLVEVSGKHSRPDGSNPSLPSTFCYNLKLKVSKRHEFRICVFSYTE
jgi:hypothetical protein